MSQGDRRDRPTPEARRGAASPSERAIGLRRGQEVDAGRASPIPDSSDAQTQ